jgi:hypothetical protein
MENNTLNEKGIYPWIKEELEKMGFPFPISDGFGIKLYDHRRRVDVFGCRWNPQGSEIETIGVEVKYLPGKPVQLEFLQGIGQCIDYLQFFKYVGLCCRDGKIGEQLERVRTELTINRITADLENSRAKFPERLIESRFNDEDSLKGVLLRSSMILSFYDAFKDAPKYEDFTDTFKHEDIKHGEFWDGGGWLAVNYKNNVQINTWYDPKTRWVCLGVNIEIKDSFRDMIEELSMEDNKKELKTLFEANKDMLFDFCKDKKTASSEYFWKEKSLSEIGDKEINDMIDKIKETLDEDQWRPHITIYVKLWDSVENKQWHENKIKKEIEKLKVFVKFFEKLV